MTNSIPLIDRGRRGPAPAPPTHDDEAALDFFTEVKNILLYAQLPSVTADTSAFLKEKNVRIEHTPEGVEAIRSAVADFNLGATWLRIMRSSQDVNWGRVKESFDRNRDVYLKELDAADGMGPGSVKYDPDFNMPDYAKVEVHNQPGGYVGDALAGYIFEQGTRVFYGGSTEDDALHQAIADKTSLPQDEKVERVMEIACSIGQLTAAFKKRFPHTEVWGTDISAPLVRYAHKRAVEQDLDIHFAQMPSEKMDFPDNHFDLVTVYILFHEIPVQIIDETLKEVYRVLRPGGTFVVWDFPSAEGDLDGLDYTGFLGVMDATDNCEPYAPEFVHCKVEDRIRNTGFTLRYDDAETISKLGRICDKPLNGND